MGLLDLFQIRQRHRGGPLPRTEPAGLTGLPSSGGHPSVDPGICASTVDDLIASESEFLQRFKYCYGCDGETFSRDIVEPIRRYASYVNLLPATADNFFCTAGGLFRLGLEVAFFALQGTDAHIVSGRATITVRKELEPRWRQATFLAGLCSELHRTLSHATVTDEQGNEWPAYLVPLTVWLERRKARRFFVRWIANAPESRSLSLFALPHIVSPDSMQHLAAANNVVVPQMLASITGIPLLHEQSILIELVKRSAALVIDRDLAASAHRTLPARCDAPTGRGPPSMVTQHRAIAGVARHRGAVHRLAQRCRGDPQGARGRRASRHSQGPGDDRRDPHRCRGSCRAARRAGMLEHLAPGQLIAARGHSPGVARHPAGWSGSVGRGSGTATCCANVHGTCANCRLCALHRESPDIGCRLTGGGAGDYGQWSMPRLPNLPARKPHESGGGATAAA